MEDVRGKWEMGDRKCSGSLVETPKSKRNNTLIWRHNAGIPGCPQIPHPVRDRLGVPYLEPPSPNTVSIPVL